MNKNIWMLPVIVVLFACGSDSDSGGGGGVSVTLPSTISWTPPTQNSDNTELTDLTKYRFYYGPDASSLQAIPELDLADTTGLVTSLNFNTLTDQDKELLTNLLQGNSTHFFAMTAINSQNIESSFSNIGQYIP